MPGYHIEWPAAKRVLVMVHGLGGDRRSTWTSAKGTYWPDLLKAEYKDTLDIYLYQYSSGFVGSCFPVTHVADDLGVYLERHKVFEKHEQVIFLAHSMGGIVVRQFLMRHMELAKKVPVAIFFATPTGGALPAQASRILPTCVQVDDMREPKSYLDSQYSNWQDSKLGERIASYCAYETQSVFVDSNSARLLCTSALAVEANHFDIVKPDTPDDPPNALVSKALNDASRKLTSGAMSPSIEERDRRLWAMRQDHLAGLRPALRVESQQLMRIADRVRDRGRVHSTKDREQDMAQVASFFFPHVLSRDISNHHADYWRRKEDLRADVTQQDDEFRETLNLLVGQLAIARAEDVARSYLHKCLGKGPGMTLNLAQNSYSYSLPWGNWGGQSKVPEDILEGYRAFVGFQPDDAVTRRCESLQRRGDAIVQSAKVLSGEALVLAERTSLSGVCEYLKID